VNGSSIQSLFFTNAAAVLSEDGDTSAPTHKFSLLGVLDNYRRTDGNLEFKLVYPELTAPNYNHWVQSSNPTTNQSVLGYQGLNVVYSSGGWRGLARSPTGSTYIDGLGTGNWWFAIGQFQSTWNGARLPGPVNIAVTPRHDDCF
jgi:hypothetical protein